MRTAIYVRVSTSKKVPGTQDFLQNPEVQAGPLRQMCAGRGWEIVSVYVDRGSGADATRPAYNDLLADAKRGKFEAVVVWRFDRFARSVPDLVNALELFRHLKIEFISHQEAIDTSSAAGKVLFTVLGAFAEFERDITRERIIAGLEYAKEHGTKSGLPIGGQPRVFSRDQARYLLDQGFSYREVARKLGVGVATIHKHCSVNPAAVSVDDATNGEDLQAG